MTLDELKRAEIERQSKEVTDTTNKEAGSLNKPLIQLIDPLLLERGGLAFTAGKKKYGYQSFQKPSVVDAEGQDGMSYLSLLGAAQRHIALLLAGEDIDSDCSERLNQPVHHLGCVLASLSMICTRERLGILTDDRVRTIIAEED